MRAERGVTVAVVLMLVSSCGLADRIGGLGGRSELSQCSPLTSSAESHLPDGARPSPGSPAGKELLWASDYETGDLSQFQNTPWNNQPVAPTVTSTHTRSGLFAGAYEIPAYGSRSENTPPSIRFSEGDERWFAFSTRLGDDVEVTSEWQTIVQWKNEGEGSPPLSLSIEDGDFILRGGWGWPGTDRPTDPKLDSRLVGPAQRGRWDDWIVRVVFSAYSTKGSASVWRNGDNVLCDVRPRGGTLYPDRSSYFKVGYYRSQLIPWPSSVYLDDVRVGTTMAAVAAPQADQTEQLAQGPGTPDRERAGAPARGLAGPRS